MGRVPDSGDLGHTSFYQGRSESGRCWRAGSCTGRKDEVGSWSGKAPQSWWFHRERQEGSTSRQSPTCPEMGTPHRHATQSDQLPLTPKTVRGDYQHSPRCVPSSGPGPADGIKTRQSSCPCRGETVGALHATDVPRDEWVPSQGEVTSAPITESPAPLGELLQRAAKI